MAKDNLHGRSHDRVDVHVRVVPKSTLSQTTPPPLLPLLHELKLMSKLDHLLTMMPKSRAAYQLGGLCFMAVSKATPPNETGCLRRYR